MKSPAELLLRRTALGVSRDLVARFANREPSSVERNERSKSFRIPADQFEALDEIEIWMESTPLPHLIAESSQEHRIDASPVIWIYGQDAMPFCPTELAVLARNDAELYRIAAGMAYQRFAVLDDFNIIVAEFLPGPYQGFCDRHSLHDTPDNRCRWWRHWMQQYVVYDRNSD